MAVRSTVLRAPRTTSVCGRMAAVTASTSCPSPPFRVRNSGAGGPCGLACAREASTPRVRLPYFCGEFDEARQHGVHAELPRIAAVDPGEQGLGQVVHRLLPVVLAHEIGDRFVVGAQFGGAQQFHPHADLGAPGRAAAS